MAEIQAETVKDLLTDYPSELSEFLSQEPLIPDSRTKKELYRLPFPPLALLHRCPQFLKKLAVFPKYSPSAGISTYILHLGKFLVRRVMIGLMKGYVFIQRERC